MTTLLVDGAGWLGAAALLLAYGLVSAGRLSGRSNDFQLLNLGARRGCWPTAPTTARGRRPR